MFIQSFSSFLIISEASILILEKANHLLPKSFKAVFAGTVVRTVSLGYCVFFPLNRRLRRFPQERISLIEEKKIRVIGANRLCRFAYKEFADDSFLACVLLYPMSI